jgi:hypothetical protein
MGVPTSEVGYISATAGRGDHEVHKGHVVALKERKKEKIKPIKILLYLVIHLCFIYACLI